MASKQQKKFDLHQLLNERSKAAAAQPHQEPNPAEGMEQLTLDVYDLIPSKENFYNTENVEDLKRSISLVGVLQPLLVKKDGDKYRIKRATAAAWPVWPWQTKGRNSSGMSLVLSGRKRQNSPAETSTPFWTA